jgi:hypothetical protein
MLRFLLVCESGPADMTNDFFIFIGFGFLGLVFLMLVLVMLSFSFRGFLFISTGFIPVPFYPFLIKDDARDPGTWLGFRDADGNNRLHLAVIACDERKVEWLSFSKVMRRLVNLAGELPVDLVVGISEKDVRERIGSIFSRREQEQRFVENWQSP